jgi:hypothetical protein
MVRSLSVDVGGMDRPLPCPPGLRVSALYSKKGDVNQRCSGTVSVTAVVLVAAVVAVLAVGFWSEATTEAVSF